MTEAEIRSHRQQLTSLAARLRSEAIGLRGEALAAPVGVAEMPTEQADLPSHQAEEERVRTVLENEELILGEVDAALTRIERGTFGNCNECGKSIGRRRLRAVPYARYCGGCAKRHEPRTGS